MRQAVLLTVYYLGQNPPFHKSQPTTSSASMKIGCVIKCGPQCFGWLDLNNDLDMVSISSMRTAADIKCSQESAHWPEDEDIETFKHLLSILPDMDSCGLAILMRKPCRDVGSISVVK